MPATNDIFEGRDKLADYLIEMDREACLALFKEYEELQHTIY